MGLFKKDKKAMTFDNAMEERRSIYNLKDSISISDDELESMIAHAVKHVPSSFNSQSTRIVLLLNDNNNKFWDNTKAILKEVMGENRDFEPTEQKIDNFKHSYGTILFYEDQDVVVVYKNKCQTTMIILQYGQLKQMPCINLQFGLH